MREVEQEFNKHMDEYEACHPQNWNTVQEFINSRLEQAKQERKQADEEEEKPTKKASTRKLVTDDVERDNLRYKAMAKYKTLRDGEIQMFSDIENELVDLAAVKGIAFENSSIEESEREIFE